VIRLDGLDGPPPRVTLRRVLAALGLGWRASPRILSTLIVLTLVDGLAPVAAAWATKLLLDELTRGREASGAAVAACAAALVAAGLIGSVVSAASMYLSAVLRRRVRVMAQARLLERINAYPGLAPFENPASLDRIRLAEHAADAAPEDVFGAAVHLGQSAVTVAGFAGTLLVLFPPMVILVVAAAVPAAWLQLRLARLRADTLTGISVVQRRQIFYRQLATDARAAKEIRLFGLGSFLSGRLLRDLHAANAAENAMDRASARLEGLLGLLAGVLTLAGVATAAWLGFQGRITAGDVVVFLAAIAATHTTVTGATEHAARAYQSLLLFGHYQDITAEPASPAAGMEAPELKEGIEFRDVWFRYADDLPWVLRGVSFTLPAGHCVGMAGVNGAGKSTIVKLLCRMYEPQRGTIRWDGIDLRDLDPATLRRRMSAVFQDFMAYDFTAADNIGVGRLEALGDRDRIRAAAALAEVDRTIADLPKGYDTMLSRIFPDDEDGRTIMLSGGQWQRIAVARAFLRDDIDLLILDEPSSGLDAHAEYVLQQRLAGLRRGRSSLLVTHRLNSMRDADLILVLDEGRVVESGTHEELIARGDRYAGLFRMQSKGYELAGASPPPPPGA